jgi:hypothetical protein
MTGTESMLTRAFDWSIAHKAPTDCRLVLAVLAAHPDQPSQGWTVTALASATGLHPAAVLENLRWLSRHGAVDLRQSCGTWTAWLIVGALTATATTAPAPPLPGNRMGRPPGRPRNPEILERRPAR